MTHISPVFWQFLVKWMTNFALFPPEASKIAPQMDALYFLHGPGEPDRAHDCRFCWSSAFPSCTARSGIRVAVQIEGSTLLEATWTIIPLGLFLIMFVWGALLYFRVYTPPANAMNIYVVGKQWMWKAEHPGGQHEINSLHVPTGRPVQLTLISQDVFHSFSIPAFRVKREAIPGRYTTVWFEATTPGTYHLFCTQYCGTNHSQMIGDIVVHDAGRLQEVAGRLHQRQIAGAERRAALCQPQLQRVPQRAARCARAQPGQRLRIEADAFDGQTDHRGRSLPARGDPESIAAHHAGLRAHHAHLPGPDQ